MFNKILKYSLDSSIWALKGFSRSEFCIVGKYFTFFLYIKIKKRLLITELHRVSYPILDRIFFNSFKSSSLNTLSAIFLKASVGSLKEKHKPLFKKLRLTLTKLWRLSCFLSTKFFTLNTS
jgi:hypothetical protein